MATIGDLVVRLGLDSRGFTQGLATGQTQLTGFAGGIDRLVTRVVGIVALTAAFVGLGSAAGALGMGVSLAAQAETARVAFETMIGSTNRARELLEDLAEFSKVTPFTPVEVKAGAQQLLAYGFSADEVMTRLQNLGDIAAGSGRPLLDFVNILGKVRAGGVASLGDVNQLAERGVPIFPALAKVMKVAESAVKSMASTGKIGLNDMIAALELTTAKGGLFEDMMIKQSRTLAGAYSTLRGNLDTELTKVGELIAEKLDLTAIVVSTSEAIEDFGKVFGAVFGTLIDFAIKYRITLGLIVGAIALVVTALAAIVIVQKAIAAAQVVMLALMGPAGWAALAVGAGVATAGLAFLESQYRAFTESAKNAKGEVAELAEEVEKLEGGATPNEPKIQKEATSEQLEEMRLANLEKIQDAADKLLNDFDTAKDPLGKFWQRAHEIEQLFGQGMLNEMQKGQLLEAAEAEFIGLSKIIADTAAEIYALEQGFSDTDREIAKIKATGSPFPGQIAEAEALIRKRAELAESIERDKKLQDDAKKIIEDQRTPLQKLGDELDRLREMFDAGHLSADEFFKAADEAAKKAGANRTGDRGGVAALQRGSAEAFSAIRAETGPDVQGKMARDIADTKQHAKDLVANAERMNDLWDSLTDEEVVLVGSLD